LHQNAPLTSYPSIGQSLVICVIIIALSIGAAPVFVIERLVGSEVAMLVYYVVTFGSSFGIAHSLRRRRIRASKYNFFIPSWRVAALVTVGSIALLLGVVSPLTSLVPLSDRMRDVLKTLGSQNGVATFTYFVIAAPVFEELIFRGIMLDGLLSRIRPMTAILVSSLLFGVVHLNAPQFITGTVMGFFLGWVYLRSRSVGACILIHMAANLSGFMMRFFVDLDAADGEHTGLLDAYGGGLIGLLFVNATLIGVFVICVWMLRAEFNKIEYRQRCNGDMPTG
jgi:uncharacterized protein